jgi:ribosomal protein S18 acetylase RimI-like enzyme
MDVISVRSLTGGHLVDFLRIYEDSFSEVERAEPGDLLASVSAGERVCLVALETGALLGFAIVLPLAGAEALFLEYMAVDRCRRNQGVGRLLLGHLREHLGQTASTGVVLEVEDPRALSAANREERLRRVAFYRRQGCAIVEAAPRYCAPGLRQAGVLPYLLMWLPATGGPSALEGDLLRRTVRAILEESYGLEPRDPLVEAALADLTAPSGSALVSEPSPYSITGRRE